MSEEPKINVKVYIADRPYRLKIESGEEENVRKAAEHIKERMHELQTTYGAKDKQDYLAMASLLICVELMENKTTGEVVDDEAHEKLDQLNTILSEFINKG